MEKMHYLWVVLTINLLLGLFFLGVFFFFLVRLYSDLKSLRGGAPYVGIPLVVAREALKLAKVSTNDTLYDLGCGDGRILKLAIAEFGVKKAVGYEIALWPFLKCKVQNAKCKTKAKNSKLEIHKKDLLAANLTKATVVFLFLTRGLLKKLRRKLQRELSENARIIVAVWGFDHPYGKPLKQKTIPWRLGPFGIYVFDKTGLATDSIRFPAAENGD